MGHDQNPGAQGQPQPAHALLGNRVEAERAGAGQLGRRRGEPDQAHVASEPLPGQAQQRQGALAEPDARAEDPDPPGARHDEGGEHAEQVERPVAQGAHVAGLEVERAHWCAAY
jgi:hypothetical protein